MSDETTECTCSASFPTSDALSSHLTEIRSQECYHSAQLEKCRSHSRVENGDNCDNSNNTTSLPILKNRTCPKDECKRNAIPFSTSQKLQRHYQQHVRCEEVCVFCFKFFNLAGDFIRHTEERHKNVTGKKADYMRTMHNELVQRSDNELSIAQNAKKAQSVQTASGKRAWDAAGMHSEPLAAQRIKTLDVTQSQFSSQSAMTYTPMPNDLGFATMGDYAETSTLATYPSFLGDGNGYDAPILHMISSIPYTEDTAWF